MRTFSAMIRTERTNASTTSADAHTHSGRNAQASALLHESQDREERPWGQRCCGGSESGRQHWVRGGRPSTQQHAPFRGPQVLHQGPPITGSDRLAARDLEPPPGLVGVSLTGPAAPAPGVNIVFLPSSDTARSTDACSPKSTRAGQNADIRWPAARS